MVGSLRALVRRHPAMVVGLAVLVGAAGCGYTSSYVPPRDGRARVVWKGEDVATDYGGLSPARCAAAVDALVHHRYPIGPSQGPAAVGSVGGGGVWVPRYWGPVIVVSRPGLAPPLLRPPLFFSPSLTIARAVAHGVRGGVGKAGVPSLRIGGGGGGGDGRVWLILAVLALLVLSVVAVAPPESASRSARDTDLVNAYNDLMRTPGSPCDVGLAGAQEVAQ